MTRLSHTAKVTVHQVGDTRFIAYLPGPDGGANGVRRLRLVGGDPSTYAAQAVTAIEAAVKDVDDATVMLVGSAQGGVAAAEIAAAAGGAGFTVDQVVTAGAPSAQVPALPKGTRMLSLEDRADPVALLGSLLSAGAANRLVVVFDAAHDPAADGGAPRAGVRRRRPRRRPRRQRRPAGGDRPDPGPRVPRRLRPTAARRYRPAGSGREPTMSKMDNLRAMREARYDKAAARAKQAGGSEPAPVAPAGATSPAPEVVADAPRSLRTPQHERAHVHPREGPRGQEPPLRLTRRQTRSCTKVPSWARLRHSTIGTISPYAVAALSPVSQCRRCSGLSQCAPRAVDRSRSVGSDRSL